MSVIAPISPPMESTGDRLMTLELKDGSALQGYSFGAPIAAAGELVFQTGMVGYPESLTDPSYEGQILVITYPLVGNYGVPDRTVMDELVKELPRYFESSRVHVAGLVVAHYTEEYSHYLATSSLGAWLKEQNVPAMYGVDTRMLTKRLREEGSTLGRLALQTSTTTDARALGNADWKPYFNVPEWVDPNVVNLVAKVSVKEPVLYRPDPATARKTASGRTVRIVAVDVGIKFNQIRCFVRRGVELLVVPWNYDYTSEEYDGLFLSNGPGDPAVMEATVAILRKAVAAARTPIFGICLGHQLLARATGASTIKLKFGNRGHNIPCTSLLSGRCYITSQNHGFAVDVDTLSAGWKPLFVNANDGSNEGIYHTEKPFFSVQFHPESTPGPRDTEFLFDTFLTAVSEFEATKVHRAVAFPGGDLAANRAAHPRITPKKVLVLGSGGLSIGQAGEFDYSGSQAIKALKEEGIYTILINPNIATIQTSKGLADKVYFLPVNADFVRKVIQREQPDGIYVTFGGQTALSVGIELKDEFAGLGVTVLGTQIETVITTEDRDLFALAMAEIGEKCAKSHACTTMEQAVAAGDDIGFPVIIRAAFALGGLGSGFADNQAELQELCQKAFAISSQVLVEKSMKGWKEVEYEVVRDAFDNCITVCNMENFDPLGIHTGDSIVVAPSQTLDDADYNMLRTTAVNVIRHLGVVGECNIQYALNPFSQEYCIIEVNARLSRSSALASKATGYPLAYTAAKLGLNIPLDEIKNSVTKVTCACFEPSLDYVVVKIPRWDLKKFTRVSALLLSSMKSVGEVMSIGRTFEEAIQKAIRSTDYQNLGFNQTDAFMSIDIDNELQTPSDQRLFAIANALSDGYSVEKIWQMTNIDKWFLNKLSGLISFGEHLSTFGSVEKLPVQALRHAKQLGFDDRQIAKFLSSNEVAVRRVRKDAGVLPYAKQIDTVAAEFPAHTNYLYLTYNASTHDVDFDDHGVVVLGSGVYRIGSSVEFDWCAVRAVRTLRENGIKTVMINYNPETVSTDYDEADRLYFETINLERVLDIYELEQSSGVVISMGGQTSNNIALALHRQNVNILGTSPEMIDAAENRYKFSRMLDRIGVDQPAWKELTSFEEAEAFADAVTYPVLVRPSYVLSGAAMNTCYSKDDLRSYLSQAVDVSPDYPVVITKFIEEAKEIEMDAVAKDGSMIMHVVSEHVENAGVHSGDATLIVPPQDLDPETVRRIVVATAKIGKALNITGPYNIQFIAKNNEIKVIECNVRASRSFPFISKVVGTDLIEMATRAIMDLPLTPYPGKPLPANYCAVKVPQFSFSRLAGADPVLGVEMASTGEVATFGRNKYEAYLKSLIATGFQLPKKNILLSIGSYKEKLELLPSVQRLHEMGYKLYATAGTADFLSGFDVPVQYLEVMEGEDEQKSEYSLSEHLAKNLIDLYINLPSANRYRRPASYISRGYQTRRMAIDYAVPLITNVKCAKVLIEALYRKIPLEATALDAQLSNDTVTLPGLVNVSAILPSLTGASGAAGAAAFSAQARESLAAGFTFLIVSSSELTSGSAFAAASALAGEGAYTDFALAATATAGNVTELTAEADEAGALFLSGSTSLATASAQLAAWPHNKVVITNAQATELASILLLASLHARALHVSAVSGPADLALVAMAKEKSMAVTCDVNVYSLFYSQEDYPQCSFLPTKAAQNALWENIAHIDCFSVGAVPALLAEALGQPAAPGVGIAETVPLLLTAVADGRLTIEDITLRLHTNPVAIFDLPVQKAFVEFDLERAARLTTPHGALKGTVERVLFDGRTVCLDGEVTVSHAFGRNYSSTLRAPVTALQTTAATPMIPSAMLEDAVLSAARRVSRVSFSEGVRPTIESLGSQLVSTLPPVDTAPSAIDALIRNNNPFLHKSVLSVRDLKRADLHALFAVALEMRLAVEREGVLDVLKGRLISTVFYEASTRTSTSFDAAMQRLGGRVVAVPVSASSVTKGESLQDTIRTLACYSDAVVLRHPDVNSAEIAAKYSPVPIINGGNGTGEHPTQALLDLFTIREELGTVNGITVTFMGDLKHGRPVHSLCHLLRQYSVRVQLVSPAELRLPAELRAELAAAGMLVCESEELTKEILAKSDVLYCTRIQQERFANPEDYDRLKDSYVVDNRVLADAKQHMCVMHPLPRVSEIREEVDFDQRAAYFRQMRYGLYVRMALLAMVIGLDFQN